MYLFIRKIDKNLILDKSLYSLKQCLNTDTSKITQFEFDITFLDLEI